MSTTIDGIVYSVASGSRASVTGYTGDILSNSTILSTVTIDNVEYSVTRIAFSAFNNCSSLTSITIPNSVTSIAGLAFYGCTSLTSITIPNSVTSIGSIAFQFCTSLTSITIPNSLTSISRGMFFGCSSLSSITIPNSVTSLGFDAFNGCTSLSSVTIPASVTSIGFDAFRTCTALLTVTINNPANVTTVNTNSFTNVRSNPSPSTITFNNTASFDTLSPTWQTIAGYYDDQIYNPPVQVPPTIGPLTIPTKTFGESPFQITDPSSNSTGSFSYESSNLEVATIEGDIITIVGIGSSIITATQAATEDYTSGDVSANFEVNQSTPENPATIQDGEELLYFLNTTATYGNIEDSIVVNSNLSSSTQKVLFTTNPNNVTITKSTTG